MMVGLDEATAEPIYGSQSSSNWDLLENSEEDVAP